MGLTGKRLRFAEGVVSGLSASEAYRRAYDARGMKPASVATEASRLLRDPKIARMVREGIEKAMRNAAWNREEAIGRLTEVNALCFERLTGGGAGSVDRVALTGFLESLDRLGTLCLIDLETSEAREEFASNPERVRARARRQEAAFKAELGFTD